MWQIVLTAADEQVHKSSSHLLTKLLQRIEMTTEVKLDVLQVCITNVKHGLADDLPIKVARCVRVLCQFIMEFEFNKNKKPKVENPDIKFQVNNAVSGS